MILRDIPKLVINLLSRPDRLAEFSDEFKHIYQGGDSYHIIEGVVHKEPCVGISRAHRSAVQFAKDNGWPMVMIMEDDVLFPGEDRTVQFVQNALADAPEDWEVLLGGVYEGNTNPHSQYWNRIGAFCGLHCYIVKASFYDHILNHNEKGHIDRWVNASGTEKVYVSSPFFAIQRVGYSDNARGTPDYSYKLKRYDIIK